MNQTAVQARRMRAYLCATCARRCLVVGEETELPQCICGGELTPALLSPGQYELIGQGGVSPADQRDSATEQGETPAGEPTTPGTQEADVGYGPSHGYDDAHGGPTGPGDAPATK